MRSLPNEVLLEIIKTLNPAVDRQTLKAVRPVCKATAAFATPILFKDYKLKMKLPVGLNPAVREIKAAAATGAAKFVKAIEFQFEMFAGHLIAEAEAAKEHVDVLTHGLMAARTEVGYLLDLLSSAGAKPTKLLVSVPFTPLHLSGHLNWKDKPRMDIYRQARENIIDALKQVAEIHRKVHGAEGYPEIKVDYVGKEAHAYYFRRFGEKVNQAQAQNDYTFKPKEA